MKKLSMGIGLLLFLSMFLFGCSSMIDTTSTIDSEHSNKYKTITEGKLTFALSGMAKPYNYTDQNNTLIGFDVDIANEVAKRLGLQPVPVQTTWGSILQGLKAGKYDAIIGGMSITEERAKQVDFSQPYFLSQAVIFVNENNSSGIKGKEDLQGKVVGVVTASTYKDFAQELVGPNGKVREYETDIFALQELKNEGRVDAVITDLGVGQHAIQESNIPVKAVGQPVYVDKCGIPVQKGNKELVEAINKALEEMRADGTYLEISKKWFNKDMLATSN
ncbi:ABC transporter substrate-binding protein [Aneurinibacillus migulanus]|uniref:ABC transporter substrate-binding protein n=1 Tax=Aneurinibacillus migulanus TaxID=47500 RepID=UPI002E1BD8A1|nr:ABC transporter substrate-binding protein [Aneurinibacillus migulanus]